MLGPVSSTGRSMMASLQQAIQKGMPVDQAIAYVKGMATQGVAPLTDLYTMMNQFQRLQQQQVKPPQTPPTIKDTLGQMDMQQRMQQQLRNQMQQGGNIQQMQAGAPAPQPMDRGLGAIDAGRMQYPQFAGGGIVAFADGGDVVHMADGPKPSMFDNLGSTYMQNILLASPYATLAPTEASQSLSGAPEYSDTQILGELEDAIDKGDQDRAEQLRGAYMQRNRSNLVSAERAIKSITDRIAAKKAATQAGTLMKPPQAAAPAAPKPTGGVPALGGNYGDFSKIRSAYTNIENQLKPAAEKTVEQNLADIEALQKKQGIGEASRKRGEYLTQREAEAAKGLDQDKRMALAQAGFAMAEAASRRGRERTGFLGAAAIGGTTGTKLYQAALKENQAIKDRIAENRFALDQADELRKSGNIKDANAMEKEAKANLRALGMARIQSEQGIAELQTRESGMDRRTAAELAASREYRKELAGLKREELNTKKLAQIAMIPNKEMREKALMEILGGIAGGEDVDDLIAKYR